MQKVPVKILREGAALPTYGTASSAGADLRACLPAFAVESMREACAVFGRRLRGYDSPDAVLTGVETRSSSPVRIPRGEDGQSVGLGGLYPCGEGAGYAGGILSSAVDGVKQAEAVLRCFTR